MPLAWKVPKIRADRALVLHHAFASCAITDTLETSVLYVHTPARYLWMPELDSRGQVLAARLLAPSLRAVDRRAARRAKFILCNSEETRRRIERYWRRDADVIHPPVRVKFFSTHDHTEEVAIPGEPFLLAVGRWISYKRFDLAIRVAASTDRFLVLCGSGPEEARLRALARELRARVKFVRNASDEVVRAYMQLGQALLFPGVEDFGIVPLEAQAAGLPVIAVGRGGALETVNDGVTGFLVEQDDVSAWRAAIDKCATLDAAACLRQAAEFAESVFDQRLAAVLARSGFDVDSARV
jgi:glycosyltransferase involved in cell wall biosynthesis